MLEARRAVSQFGRLSYGKVCTSRLRTRRASLHEFDGGEDEPGQRDLRGDEPSQDFDLDACRGGFDLGLETGFDPVESGLDLTKISFGGKLKGADLAERFDDAGRLFFCKAALRRICATASVSMVRALIRPYLTQMADGHRPNPASSAPEAATISPPQASSLKSPDELQSVERDAAAPHPLPVR